MDMLVGMLVVPLELADTLGLLAGAEDMDELLVVGRRVLVVDHMGDRADCTLVWDTQSVEDMLEHLDIVDLVLHQVTEVHHWHQLVDIEDIGEALDNQERPAAVEDMHVQMEGMLKVGASADRRELLEVLVLELLAVPMMLF